MLFNYWLTYSVLKAKRPKFERMRAPTISELTQEGESSLEDVDESGVPSFNGNGSH